MITWTLAAKDLRLLVRDRRGLIILLGMPLLFILILGMSLGEGFFKPDNRLRITVVDLDDGKYTPTDGFPDKKWSLIVRDDLLESAGIRLVDLPSREEAEAKVRSGEISAVLVFGPEFSRRVSRCSFLASGINPFYRDGIKLTTREAGRPAAAVGTDELDVELLIDPTQRTAASIIEQVAQVSLLRVVMPWMISNAFGEIGTPRFIDRLAPKVKVFGVTLDTVVRTEKDKADLGKKVKDALQEMLAKYRLEGKTWADLTRSGPRDPADSRPSGGYSAAETRYQILVPSYTVMFAFFLVLTVGWMFVGERRQGTMKRLRAAPITRTQILLGKMVPCFLISLAQGLFLLAAGKLVFKMSWGPDPVWLLPVVVTTSLAAMGMSLMVASLARSETQVSIYGTMLVLVMAGMSGCLMPRELMPESMKQISRVTPHAWALDAYNQLLTSPDPNLVIVSQACAVLAAFGVGFLLIAWAALRLD